MPFLALNGTTVPCKSDNVNQSDEEHGIDRGRMFDGTLRMTRIGLYRSWKITTKLLSEADANTLLALVHTGGVLTASGDLVGDDVAVMPIPGSNDPVQWAGGFRRRLTFELKETGGPLPPDTSAVPFLFLRRNTGMWQDSGRTIAAGDGDRVYVWEDQASSHTHAVADWGSVTGDDVRPVRDGLSLRFGTGPSTTTGAEGNTGLALRRTAALVDLEIMIVARPVADPAAAGAFRTELFALYDGGFAGTLFPDDAGHIQESTGTNAWLDVGDPADDLSASFNVLDVSASNTDAQKIVRLNNTILPTTGLPGGGTFVFGGPGVGAPTYGGSIGRAARMFDGWIKELVIFDGILTDSQRRSWYDYLRGVVTLPPLP